MERGIGPQTEAKGVNTWPSQIGDAAPPLGFRREAAVGAGDAAQQAVVRILDRRIGGLRAAAIQLAVWVMESNSAWLRVRLVKLML